MPIIDLSKTDTGAFGNENFIQVDAKNIFVTRVEQFLQYITELDKNSDRNTNDLVFDRVHNTILVNGKRGAGKTSFILSVVNSFSDNSSVEDKVTVLRVIDPTMIETKEHIFLNILSLIKEKIDKLVSKDKVEISDYKYKAWKDCLRKLASGLNVLDGIGSEQLKDALWDSPQLILEQGLDNSKQGFYLEQNFHEFIHLSLNVLDKKAFVLIFDDIDTSLNKGKEILEILRKYLTSPRLIIALLGDIDLYSTIVRQLQWEKMDPRETLKKYENIEAFKPQIEYLEEQYLTKILKPENRITLKTLYDLKNNLEIRSAHGEEESKLDFFMNDLVEQVFLTTKSTSYSKMYIEVLLEQSARSVVQIIKGWDESSFSCQSIIERSKKFIATLYQIFYTTLKSKLGEYSLLEINSSDSFLNRLAVYMIKTDNSRDNYMKLLPEQSGSDENVSRIYLNVLFNYHVQPENYLSYFVKVGYLLQCFESYMPSVNSGKEIDRLAVIDNFIDHIAINTLESNANLARRLLTTFDINSNTHTVKPVFFGNFSLSGENLKSIKNKNNYSLFLSRVYNPKSGHHTFISIFSLIGFLADLCVTEENDNLFNKISQVRDFYSLKDLETKSTDDLNTSSTEDDDFDITEVDKENLINWARKTSEIKQKLSAADLSKIWIRFVYSINSIDSHSANKGKSYTELLALYISALLNSAYIICELKKGNNVSVKNPAEDPNFFSNKIESYKVSNNYYTFFDFLYECPALKYDFINIPDEFTNRKPTVKYKTMAEKSENKINFKNLSNELKEEAIRKIDNWDNYKTSTLPGKLREIGYTKITDLNKLHERMKSNL